MKTHTADFKTEIAKLGKQQMVQLVCYVDVVPTILINEHIINVSLRYQGSLLKSVMKTLEFESTTKIPVGTRVNFLYGLLVNNSMEYIDYGDFMVKEVKKQEDKRSYVMTCYDHLIESMKDYTQPRNVTYPITIKEYIRKLCPNFGMVFKSPSGTFPNQDKQIPKELYLDSEGNSIGYTYRDILDELAQVTASTICVAEDGRLELRYINDTGDTIDENYFKDINVAFGEKYGPINSIVLTRSGGSDSVYLQDETSVEQNGLCEIKIEDNQIMNFNNRSEFLPAILNQLLGTEYYLNDFTSTGIMYYDLCDKYTASVGGNSYTCIMFNDEINVTQGLEETIYTEKPEDSETDYKKSDTTDIRINQAYVIVDKQSQDITALTNQVTTTTEIAEGNTEMITTISDNLTEVKQNVQGVTTTISQIEEQQGNIQSDIATLQQTIQGLQTQVQHTGGNNIFRYAKEFWDNTILDNETGEYGEAELDEYTDTDLQQNSISGLGYIINQGTSRQIAPIGEGTYTISFKYKKLLNLANTSVSINGATTQLNEENWTEFTYVYTGNTSIDLEFTSSDDGALEVADVMGNVGSEAMTWTQNPNETITDTVTIGKGIQVESSTSNTYTRIDDDGNRTFNRDTNEVVMEATDKGVATKYLTSREGAKISGLIIQEVNNQVWLSAIND